MTKLNPCGQVVKGLLITVNVLLLVSTAMYMLTRDILLYIYSPILIARHVSRWSLWQRAHACTRLLFVVLSLQLLGLFAIGAGSAGLVENILDLAYVTGSDVFSGEAVIIATGVAITIVAALGIAAGAGEMWGIVLFVSQSCLKFQFCCLWIVFLKADLLSCARHLGLWVLADTACRLL